MRGARHSPGGPQEAEIAASRVVMISFSIYFTAVGNCPVVILLLLGWDKNRTSNHRLREASDCYDEVRVNED